jgi:hypothetical protein
MPAWEELETKGFVVVPGFLGQELIEVLLRDFETGAAPETFPFGFKPVGRRALAAVTPHLDPVLAQIRAGTSLVIDTVNFLTLSHYVTTRLAKRTSFLHQDFDLDYRLSGDHVNYLNFWIPLRKPDPQRSNLSLVPFDVLRERSPEGFERVRGGGGLRWVPNHGRTSVHGSHGAVLEGGESPPLFWLDFDAEELAVTPFTQVGDLVLMRGDLPHRTQDQETERVAVSIRATSTAKLLSVPREAADQGDPAAPLLSMLSDCCAHMGRDQVTVGEFVNFAQGRR